MKSRREKHKAGQSFGTNPIDGHHGKPPAQYRKLKRGEKKGRAERIRPKGTGAGTSCPHSKG